MPVPTVCAKSNLNPVRFDFAISFAGPERALARELYQALSRSGANVFFDERFAHEMLGRDGVDFLNNVFFRDSRFSVVLLSASYEKSSWTQVERHAIMAKAVSNSVPVLLPILVDGFKPPWLLPTTVYFDLSASNMDALVEVLLRKQVREGRSFKLVAELDVGEDLLAQATSEDDEFVFCSRAGLQDDGRKPQPLKLVTSSDSGSWNVKLLPITRKARFAFKVHDKCVLIQERGTEPVVIHDLARGSSNEVFLPSGAFQEVIECDCHGSTIVIGRADAGAFTLDVADLSVHVVHSPTKHVDYTAPAQGEEGRIMLVFDYRAGLFVPTANAEYSNISTFEPDSEEYLWRGGYNESAHVFLVGGSEWLYVLHGESFELIAKKRLAVPEPGAFSCSRFGSIAAAVGSAYSGSGTIDIYDASTGECIDCIDRPAGHKWEYVTLSSNGRTLCAQTRLRDDHRKTFIYEQI